MLQTEKEEKASQVQVQRFVASGCCASEQEWYTAITASVTFGDFNIKNYENAKCRISYRLYKDRSVTAQAGDCGCTSIESSTITEYQTQNKYGKIGDW